MLCIAVICMWFLPSSESFTHTEYLPTQSPNPILICSYISPLHRAHMMDIKVDSVFVDDLNGIHVDTG